MDMSWSWAPSVVAAILVVVFTRWPKYRWQVVWCAVAHSQWRINPEIDRHGPFAGEQSNAATSVMLELPTPTAWNLD
jgi:hypothetical protein